VALVTLDKRIREKFGNDLCKQDTREGVIALFCNVDVSPKQKFDFTKEALAKGFRLEVFDLERLRSLLDSSLKDVRRRYLGIDDDIATNIRSDVTRLLHFPDAVADTAQPPTLAERLLRNKIPQRLFDLLMTYEQKDVREVPGVGRVLGDYVQSYYEYRKKALALEERLFLRIGQLVSVRFPEGWRIYLRYVVMRFAGASQENIIGWGEFLNYDITWEDAERVFKQLNDDQELSPEMSQLFDTHSRLRDTLGGLLSNERAA